MKTLKASQAGSIKLHKMVFVISAHIKKNQKNGQTSD